MSHEIVCGDVMEWAASYKGPKFHALLCDPPYHLTSPAIGWQRMANGRGKPIITDRSPVGFMGKKWDGGDIAYRPETWTALAEHLLLGAFGIAFASSRGWHRLACAIEDAGLIIHPSIFGWCYGSGFPKATRIDTQIEPRSKIGRVRVDGKLCGHNGGTLNSGVDVAQTYSPPTTDLARAWAGHRYGLQTLKPALEPIIVFQKPYEGKPVECITETGAGALNIDGGRIGYEKGGNLASNPSLRDNIAGGCGGNVIAHEDDRRYSIPSSQGRWPANFYLQHSPLCVYKGTKRVKNKGGVPSKESAKESHPAFTSEIYTSTQHYFAPDGKETVADWECVEECPVRRLGEQSGHLHGSGNKADIQTSPWIQSAGVTNFGYRTGRALRDYGKQGGTAARFFLNVDWRLEQADPVFYAGKATRNEREKGLRGYIPCIVCRKIDTETHPDPKTGKLVKCHRCGHPTVKPLALCKWLATLLLPPGEHMPRRILVPFTGSGSEMIGAALVGWEEVIGSRMRKSMWKLPRHGWNTGQSNRSS